MSNKGPSHILVVTGIRVVSTEQLAKERGELERAAGKFLLAWAPVELEMNRVLVHYAGVTDAVGRAIFAGTRADAAMRFIKAIAHNTDLARDRNEDLVFVFLQAALLNTARNFILHQQVLGETSDDSTHGLHFGDYDRVSRYGNDIMLTITVKDLEDMTVDAAAIRSHLSKHLAPDPFAPWDKSGKRTTWLYKSAQLAGSQARSADRAQEGKRQRKPSPRK